jgi:hypothetical protein
VALAPDADASNLETWLSYIGPKVSAVKVPDEPKVSAVEAPAAPVELRVGMTVWAAVPLDQVKNNRGSLRVANNRHDVGVVVGLCPKGVTVVWRHVRAWNSGYKVEWATHSDRRSIQARSLLLTANPRIPPREGPSELYKVVSNLKGKQPQLTAKQVHEQVCASALLPEPASLAAVKRCLELLLQDKRCPLLNLLPDDLFIDEIANELPLAALLNLSTTCSKAREVLTPTRLERSKEAVEATDRRRIRMSGGIYW